LTRLTDAPFPQAQGREAPNSEGRDWPQATPDVRRAQIVIGLQPRNVRRDECRKGFVDFRGRASASKRNPRRPRAHRLRAEMRGESSGTRGNSRAAA